MFERLLEIINKEDLKRIHNAKILLVGIGGVGGYTLESLVRSGFLNITIIDGDVITESNLNRQIIACSNNIGEIKTNEAKKRMISINPDAKINCLNVFLTLDNFNDYIKGEYDYIIDACDDVPIKIELIKYAKNNNIKIISCLGTGKKLDPTKLCITTLNKTYNDPLAKKLRHELRKFDINLNIPVIFSKEEPINNKEIIGSTIFVPATAGIYLANYIFLDLISK
ncbi:MAG: tRNA threonylcarbamoyladenosine dehydratase [Firmicutes bacterium]|nr:tRNA threonylcarbamoyladenosine dehydratase [Bacillota bacterium]